MQIIGIGGKAGAGKDTIAEFLTEYGFERKAFGDVLKKVTSQALDIPLEMMYDRSVKDSDFDTPIHFSVEALERLIDALEYIPSNDIKKEIGTIIRSPRHAMQYIGTDVVREYFDTDMWTKQLDKEVNGPTVISDVRFKNEREYVKSKGGILMLVERENSLKSEHLSENDLGDKDEYQVIVNNNMPKFRLKEEIYIWYQLVRGGKL